MLCGLRCCIPKTGTFENLVCMVSNLKVSVMGLSAAAQYNGENGTVRQIRSLKNRRLVWENWGYLFNSYHVTFSIVTNRFRLVEMDIS